MLAWKGNVIVLRFLSRFMLTPRTQIGIAMPPRRHRARYTKYTRHAAQLRGDRPSAYNQQDMLYNRGECASKTLRKHVVLAWVRQVMAGQQVVWADLSRALGPDGTICSRWVLHFLETGTMEPRIRGRKFEV